MPRFAANLSMLWPELDVYDRFPAAAEAGFSRVEILFIHTLDIDRVDRLLREHHLELILFDPAPGNWDAGERGLAALPDRREDFKRTIQDALVTAERLGVKRLNVLAGIPSSGSDPTQSVVDNFGWAGDQAESTGVTVLVENINNIDMVGYPVNTAEQAANIVKAVNRPNVRLQLDQYHVGMMGGDARAALRAYKDLVQHVQIADVPGRHEPGSGQQPIREFLADLDALGYQGSVGLEYRPSGPTDASLAWLPREARA